jgi:hypothetical protein
MESTIQATRNIDPLYLCRPFFHLHQNACSRVTLGFDYIAENNTSVTNHDQKQSGVSLAPLHISREIHELAFEANIRRIDLVVRFWFVLDNERADPT